MAGCHGERRCAHVLSRPGSVGRESAADPDGGPRDGDRPAARTGRRGRGRAARLLGCGPDVRRGGRGTALPGRHRRPGAQPGRSTAPPRSGPVRVRLRAGHGGHLRRRARGPALAGAGRRAPPGRAGDRGRARTARRRAGGHAERLPVRPLRVDRGRRADPARLRRRDRAAAHRRDGGRGEERPGRSAPVRPRLPGPHRACRRLPDGQARPDRRPGVHRAAQAGQGQPAQGRRPGGRGAGRGDGRRGRRRPGD